ncbi:MAG TPA: PilZ domain-containing protein [Thermoanaerobaculia bacterium]|nr:PilZ domain-containing protein [Thermoanaerobaculia bacterium]
MSPKLAMDAVRRSNRFRVVLNLPLRIGLKTATLVDISNAGVLATHAGHLKTGANVEISFVHTEQKFQATAQVASCTVVGLGAGEGGATLYASRLYFTKMSEDSRKLLESVVVDQ